MGEFSSTSNASLRGPQTVFSRVENTPQTLEPGQQKSLLLEEIKRLCQQLQQLPEAELTAQQRQMLVQLQGLYEQPATSGKQALFQANGQAAGVVDGFDGAVQNASLGNEIYTKQAADITIEDKDEALVTSSALLDASVSVDVEQAPDEKTQAMARSMAEVILSDASEKITQKVNKQAVDLAQKRVAKQEEQAAQLVALGKLDGQALMQWVLKYAYEGNSEHLRLAAFRMKFYADVRKSIQKELTRARKAFTRVVRKDPAASEDRSGKEPQKVLAEPYQSLTFQTEWQGSFSSDPDNIDFASAAEQLRTPEQLKAYIDDLEQLLGSVGDDAQLAQLDLQNWTQRQQQALNTISGISKSLHETAMSIIRKIAN